MSVLLKPMETASQQVGIANTTLYTCPAGKTARVFSLTITNTDETTGYWVKVHKCKVGDAIADDTLLVAKTDIPPRGTVDLLAVAGVQVFEASGFFSAIAEAGAKLTVHISGAEVTP